MYFSFVIFLVSTINLISCGSSNSGHLKPFGTVGSLMNIEEINGEYPNILKFFTHYVPKLEPIVSRQVLINDMYYNIWQTDRELENEVDGLSKTNINVESLKERKRIQMKFGDFFDQYTKESLLLADYVPEILRKYIVVPRPLQCDEVVHALQSPVLLINSINTSPLMFNDEHDFFFCLLRGNKRLVLVNTIQYPAARQIVIPDKQKPRRPPLNPENVDLNQYPELENVEYHVANLTAGDCIFIPNGWIFQERSLDSTISILYNINHKQALQLNLEELKTCSESDPLDSPLTLDRIDWTAIESDPENIRDVIMNLINSPTNTYEKWQDAFSKYFTFDLTSDSDISAIFDEFYGIIDIDGNGEVTTAEIEQINGVHQHHISDVLYELMNLVDEKRKLASATAPTTEDENAQETIENEESSDNEDEDLHNYKTDL
ncbi:unnamed protein product [Rotaria magnacalcarata]|uniref:JmjC domain-containing protein n=2 Tax=Rotaria magnacalcarata TaxID=392030 RepID=A0A816BUK8_9BILA|nr:unnamed protein product [Rotaria magnacalcarata]CAF1613021.1 unnamed protein product [Rotaria magnacalcarata]CAF2108638.1 unnamed protein product [Rotaria magnacalcarata]CAF3755111.1 unnamed protein product [Rotaria magnacalcarata]CAF3789059.1 unnamed protein product [Rotaria magnacalcarata]